MSYRDDSNVQGAGLGQEGRDRASRARLTPAAERRRSIRTALVNLGGTDRSIDPDVVRRYDAILNCPAVSQLAGRGADKALRSTVAVRLILDAIRAIKRDDLREIARASMAVGRYEGKSVDARVDELGPWITRNQYKHGRLRAIAHILDRLMEGDSEEPSSPRYTGPLIPAEHAPAIYALECLHRDVRALESAFSAKESVLYVEETINRAKRDHLPQYRFSTAIFQRAICNAVENLYVSMAYCFGSQEFSRRLEVQAFLPAALFVLVQDVMTDARNLIFGEVEYAHQMVAGHFGLLPSLREARWYRDAFRASVNDLPASDIYLLVIACLEIAFGLENYVPRETDATVVSMSGVSLVAEYYGIRPQDPFHGTTIERLYSRYRNRMVLFDPDD